MSSIELCTLITGASGGFGRALCVECAARKMNIIIADLPGTGLDRLASFIQRNYQVKVLWIETDLSVPGGCEQLYHEIKLHNVLINILINNAGIGGTSFFEEKNAEDYSRQIYLNTAVPTILVRLLFDDLRKTKGCILNVASLAAFFILPGKQVYSATKNYIVVFSKALRDELKQYKVKVAVVCPGGMDTTLELILKHKKCNWFSRLSVMQPQRVARISLDGLLAGRAVIIPGVTNKIFLSIAKFLPESAKKSISSREIKRLISRPPIHQVTGSIAS